MALTAAQIAMVNKANEANRRSSFGTAVGTLETNVATLQGLKYGSHTVIADEQTANTVAITTGLTAIAGYIFQIFRSGVNVTADAAASLAEPDDGSLNVADGAATYSVTTGDVINWFAW